MSFIHVFYAFAVARPVSTKRCMPLGGDVPRVSPAGNSEQPKDDHQRYTQDVSLTQGDIREYCLKEIIHYPAVFMDKSND